MKKKKKGLADGQDGDFILNESATSVNYPRDEAENRSGNQHSLEEDEEEDDNETTNEDDEAR